MTDFPNMEMNAPDHGASSAEEEDAASNSGVVASAQVESVFTGTLLDVDPNFARALIEQLENALVSTSSPIVLLTIDLLGEPKCMHGGSADDVYEAIIESGFGGTSQVIVSDLENDPRVPATWRGRGLGASLSTPIEADQRQIGELHVLDTRSRDYSAQQCEAIADIAYIIGKRIEKFLGPEREERRESLMCRAVSPAFAELRNALVPLSLGTSDLRVVAGDLRPVISRLGDSKDELDIAALVAFTDLEDLIDEIARASARVREVVMVVEDVWAEGGRSLMLSEILDTACGLALHSTRLVGGVEIAPVSPKYSIVGRRSVVIATLGLLISRAAEANASGVIEVTPLDIEIVASEAAFEVLVHGSNLKHEERETICAEVNELLLGDADVGISTAEGELRLRLTRAT